MIAVQAAGARAYSNVRRNGSGILAKGSLWPPLTKAQCVHNQRRTAVMASENVTPALPSQSTPDSAGACAGNCSYSDATTLYKPNKHGSARSTVGAHQPRVVSSPRYERISAKVVSMFQRAAYCSMISFG